MQIKTKKGIVEYSLYLSIPHEKPIYKVNYILFNNNTKIQQIRYLHNLYFMNLKDMNNYFNNDFDWRKYE